MSIRTAPHTQTLKLLPEGSVSPDMRSKLDATPKTPSFLHLHLGIDAAGLPADLECHHTVVNSWDQVRETGIQTTRAGPVFVG